MSPEVWGDVRPRIQAVADAQGFTVSWPNEAPAKPDTASIWLLVEFSSAADEPIEIGAQTWQEDGAIWLHIMLPRLTGITGGLAVKDALSVAFRTAAPSLAGLVYRGNAGSPGQTLDPLDQGTDDGMFMRLTMSVRYIFQSRVVDTPVAGDFLLLIGGGPLLLTQGGGLILEDDDDGGPLNLIGGGPLLLVEGGSLLLEG